MGLSRFGHLDPQSICLWSLFMVSFYRFIDISFSLLVDLSGGLLLTHLSNIDISGRLLLPSVSEPLPSRMYDPIWLQWSAISPEGRTRVSPRACPTTETGKSKHFSQKHTRLFHLHSGKSYLCKQETSALMHGMVCCQAVCWTTDHANFTAQLVTTGTFLLHNLTVIHSAYALACLRLIFIH